MFKELVATGDAVCDAMDELYTITLHECKLFSSECKKYLLMVVCIGATMRDMNTDTAIKLAGSREKLAELLGVASITTYRWKPSLPQHRADRLRILKPRWFHPSRIEAIEREAA